MKTNHIIGTTTAWIIIQSITRSDASGPSSFYPHRTSVIKTTMKNIHSRSNMNQLSTSYQLKSATLLSKIIDIRGGANRGYGYDDMSGNGGGGRSTGGYYYDDDNDQYGSSSSKQDYDDGYGASRRNDSGGYEDDYYYEDQGYKKRDYAPSSRKKSRSSPLSNIPDVGGILRNGNKQVGFALLGAGFVFTMLGISLFFNKTLMRLGNLFFIAGVPMTIGPGRTTGYFLQPKKARATGCLGLGIFLVFIGYPFFGIAFEIFGILNLFGNMFPIFMVILKQMPVIGNLLNGDNGKKSNSKNNRKYDYSYEDEDDYQKGDNYNDDRYSERSGYY